MNFTWYSLYEDTGTIQIAKSSEVTDGDMPANAAAFTATAIDSTDTGWKSNQVTVSNLEANTEYCYQITNGSQKSEMYTFKTDGEGEFGFAYLADAQLGVSGYLEHSC